jgi:hypothetical protein
MNMDKILKGEDETLLFCVKTGARSLEAIGKHFKVTWAAVWQHFDRRNIDFQKIKRYLKKIDFIDSDWWENNYQFEEGEEARQYLERYWITNYGTPLTQKQKVVSGHLYSKFVKLSPTINKNYYQIILSTLNGPRNEYIHKMVAQAWVKKKNPHSQQVRHKNENTLDNHYWNLVWL